MTHDLTTRLTGTLSGLELGLPISALNRLRRRDEELAAEREAVATDLGDHGCDRSTALHFAAIVVAGLVARGKL